MGATSSVLCALLAGAGAVQAQARFDSVTREAVAAVPGLEVLTVRDRALESCYTLFLFQPPSPAAVAPPVDSTTLAAAAAERDSRLDALSADLQRTALNQRPGLVPSPLRYQFEGEKVLADFEQVAREAILARLDARLTAIAAAPRLAVAGPLRCPAVPPVAEAAAPAGRP
jgi:hypothetical protein